MKRFSFQFETLLSLRMHQRDVCRRLLADVLNRDDGLAARRRAIEVEHRTQIDELRNLSAGGNELDIDASTSRRNFAVQLTAELHEIDSRRAELAEQIGLCRPNLARAEQAVKTLEKLAEKQQAEFHYHQERVAARALEEAWQAMHAGKGGPLRAH
jgi:flagellar biosynthesis chaperone FliJ